MLYFYKSKSLNYDSHSNKDRSIKKSLLQKKSNTNYNLCLIGHEYYSVIADIGRSCIFDSRMPISSHFLHWIQCGFNPL